MWIDESVDFSPVKDEIGNDTYPYNDKEFTVTVNVYANAKVVTEEDIELESKAEISNLTVDGTELTKVENQDYDYETSLPVGTTSTTINVETQSLYATVNVERIDSLAYSKSNIKRLSTVKTLDLNPGNNYFKKTIISENGKIENEYKLKIEVSADQSDFIEGEKLFLYKNGLINEYLTGGYKVVRQGYNSDTTFENDYIYSIATHSNTGYGRKIFTNNKINLTGYSQIYVLCTALGQKESTYNTLSLTLASDNTSYSTTAYKYVSSKGIVENKELVLDITDINDSYYLYVGIGSLSPVYIYQIWLS